MNTKITSRVLMLIMTLLSFTSCSEDTDNPDYASTLPIISEVKVTPNPIIAGQDFIVTIVQSKKGHLLNSTTYEWNSSMYNTLDEKPTYEKSLIYDNSNGDPEMIMTAVQQKGVYSLTFKASYKNSGQASGATGTTHLDDGSNVTYTVGLLKSYISITKTVTVK